MNILSTIKHEKQQTRRRCFNQPWTFQPEHALTRSKHGKLHTCLHSVWDVPIGTRFYFWDMLSVLPGTNALFGEEHKHVWIFRNVLKEASEIVSCPNAASQEHFKFYPIEGRGGPVQLDGDDWIIGRKREHFSQNNSSPSCCQTCCISFDSTSEGFVIELQNPWIQHPGSKPQNSKTRAWNHRMSGRF